MPRDSATSVRSSRTSAPSSSARSTARCCSRRASVLGGACLEGERDPGARDRGHERGTAPGTQQSDRATVGRVSAGDVLELVSAPGGVRLGEPGLLELAARLRRVAARRRAGRPRAARRARRGRRAPRARQRPRQGPRRPGRLALSGRKPRSGPRHDGEVEERRAKPRESLVSSSRSKESGAVALVEGLGERARARDSAQRASSAAVETGAWVTRTGRSGSLLATSRIAAPSSRGRRSGCAGVRYSQQVLVLLDARTRARAAHPAQGSPRGDRASLASRSRSPREHAPPDGRRAPPRPGGRARAGRPRAGRACRLGAARRVEARSAR